MPRKSGRKSGPKRKSGSKKGCGPYGSKYRVKAGTARCTSGGLRPGDIEIVVKKGRRGIEHIRYMSKKKRQIGRTSPHLKAWRKAAQDEGYLKKGEKFQRLPVKNSAAYGRILDRYHGKRTSVARKSKSPVARRRGGRSRAAPKRLGF